MPRPKYIICAESVAHDKVTNLMSFFHVLEGYHIVRNAEPIPEGSTPVMNAPFRLTGIAAWELVEGDDPEEELEYQLTLAYPGAEVQTVQEGNFRMSKRFHRFTARIETPGVPIGETGTIVFTSKVRRHGANEWLTQEYAIPIEVVVAPAANQEQAERQEA